MDHSGGIYTREIGKCFTSGFCPDVPGEPVVKHLPAPQRLKSTWMGKTPALWTSPATLMYHPKRCPQSALTHPAYMGSELAWAAASSEIPVLVSATSSFHPILLSLCPPPNPHTHHRVRSRWLGILKAHCSSWQTHGVLWTVLKETQTQATPWLLPTTRYHLKFSKRESWKWWSLSFSLNFLPDTFLGFHRPERHTVYITDIIKVLAQICSWLPRGKTITQPWQEGHLKCRITSRTVRHSLPGNTLQPCPAWRANLCLSTWEQDGVNQQHLRAFSKLWASISLVF